MSNSCSSCHKCSSANLPCKCSSNSTFIESVSSGFPFVLQKNVKTVDYEKFKPLLQEYSSITNRNLFDHLVEVIKRVIDERPRNVIDYFEEYSRDVREHKLTAAEDASNVSSYVEPQFLQIAKAVLKPFEPQQGIEDVEDGEDAYENVEYHGESQMTIYASSESSIAKIQRDLARNENVIQLQQFWAFCGLGFHIDEAFQLSWAVQKVQLHQGIQNARFWGRIYGLDGSYYVAEATLTRSETENRSKSMNTDVMTKLIEFITRRDHEYDDDTNSIPGTSWQNRINDEFKKIQSTTPPIPQHRFKEEFEMPAESVGCGLNRRVYFVTTSLSKEWQELPIVTPKQIEASKKIKKLFTGNLEASLSCYPPFPGTEKDYLRTMIARITSGTYIAPKGFYGRMSEMERKRYTEELCDEKEDFGDEYDSKLREDQEDLSNDDFLTQNSGYEPHTLEELTFPENWVHVRPNILNQGRVVYIDKVHAFKCLEEKALLKMKRIEIYEGEGEEESQIDEDKAEEEPINGTKPTSQDKGPPLFSSCSFDTNKENIAPWTCRYTSVYDKTNQKILVSSNLWPGAYSFAFDKFSDSIYHGWGLKYVSRYTSLESLPNIEDIVSPDVASELTDPTVDMEEKWRVYQLKNEVSVIDEMSDISVDYDVDDKGDEEL